MWVQSTGLFLTAVTREFEWWLLGSLLLGVGTAMVYPSLAFAVRPHVLFSYDGKEIWQSVERLHRARMNQCRNWWNDDWRDRILATMNWLAEGGDTIAIPLGGQAVAKVRNWPLLFRSEISFIEPGELGFADADDMDEPELDELSTDSDEDSGDQ